MQQAPAIPWLSDARDAWLADATAWINEQVERLQLGPQPDVASVREQPWSAVLRVTTRDRTVLFFKAEGLGGRHEPRIAADLSPDWPALVPEVLALDETRSWFLMADHGVPMWDVLDSDEQLELFAEMLPPYATMQQATTGLARSWIDAGAPDRRMDRLPRLLEDLLAGRGIGDEPFELDENAREAMQRLLPEFERVCRELAAVPDALDHGDVHGGNVLVGERGSRLIDWGDSCITDPFASLFVTYEVSLARMDSVDKPAAARRLRDAYLEGWADLAPKDELRERFVQSMWAAHISRAMDYVHMLNGATPELVAEWHHYIRVLLTRWLDRYPLLTRGDELVGVLGATAGL